MIVTAGLAAVLLVAALAAVLLARGRSRTSRVG